MARHLFPTNQPLFNAKTKQEGEEMKCEDCKHWEPSKDNKNYLPEDYVGECDQIGAILDIELVTGYDGGYVESIETPINFGCSAFEAKT